MRTYFLNEISVKICTITNVKGDYFFHLSAFLPHITNTSVSNPLPLGLFRMHMDRSPRFGFISSDNHPMKAFHTAVVVSMASNSSET